MPQFTRQKLYDFVWSEPDKILAARIDISEVGFAKACRNAGITVSERGYWAELKASKSVVEAKLPQRGIGASDTLEVAKGRSGQTPFSINETLVTEFLSVQALLPS